MSSNFLSPQPVKCQTCIFRSSNEGGLPLPIDDFNEITTYLAQGNQHICHTDTSLACRGGRELQLQVFHALGWIDAPTDEALHAANEAYLEQFQAKSGSLIGDCHAS